MNTIINRNIYFVSRKLANLTHFTFRGHEISPVKHLYLKNTTKQRAEKVVFLDKFVDMVSVNILIYTMSTALCLKADMDFIDPFSILNSASKRIWPLQMLHIWNRLKNIVRSLVFA